MLDCVAVTCVRDCTRLSYEDDNRYINTSIQMKSDVLSLSRLTLDSHYGDDSLFCRLYDKRHIVTAACNLSRFNGDVRRGGFGKGKTVEQERGNGGCLSSHILQH